MKTLYDGATFEHGGHTFRVKFPHDDYSGYPWDECDGHGTVRKSHSPHYDGRSDKKPGERPLNHAGRNNWQFYYDWAGACKEARRDGWNAKPFDAPNRIARAVEANFQYLRAFLNDEWHYVGVIVEMLDDEGEQISKQEMWRIETWKNYHYECARELAEELLYEFEANQAQEFHDTIATDAAEAVEANTAAYWATRDVMTRSNA